MPRPISFTEEGAKLKQRVVDLFDTDPDVAAKANRQKNIVVQTPDDEIMPVLKKLFELGLPPDKALNAISSFEQQTFLNYRPVPWDEIHHQRGLDIFTSVRHLPVSERAKALDMMHQSGHTLGDTRENLLGTSFDVRTHTGGAFKGKMNDGRKVRDVLKLNPGIAELSAHPFGTKETRPGVIVPTYENAGDWFNHAQESAKTVEIDAARGIAIEQPRRQIVNNILQRSKHAPPIESFDVFNASPQEVRDAAAFFGNKRHERARLAIYKGWKVPTNLDPELIPKGMTADQFKKVAQYFPADMVKFGAALPVIGALFDANQAYAGTKEAATTKSKRNQLAGALDAVSGTTGLATLAPSPASLPLAAISAGTGLLSTAVRSEVDKKAIKAAPKVAKSIVATEKKLNPVHHAINNELKYRGKQLFNLLIRK
jgi:hypothetical protein